MRADDLSARLAKLSPAQRTVLARMVGERAGDDAPDGRTPVETALLGIWREVFGDDRIGVTDSFTAIGGDSITSLRVAVRAAAAGIRVTSRQVLEEETVERLARVAGAAEVGAQQDGPVGEVTPTPIQRWFLEQPSADSHHRYLALAVDLAAGVDEDVLRAALAELVAHHDVLRSRFRERDGRWRHVVSTDHPAPRLAVVDLGHLDEAGRRTRIAAATAIARDDIDLASGPLLTAVLFRLGAVGPDQLLLVVHHLVVDGASMRVLLDDLATAYRDLRAGVPVALPAEITSYRLWSSTLARRATEEDVLSQAAYWRAVPDAAAVSAALGGPPTGADGVLDTAARSATMTVEVSARAVRALRRAALRSSDTSVLHLVLTAFALAWRDRTGRAAVQVDLHRHGREQLDDAVDVSRTVGWFTAVHPVVLALPGTTGSDTAVGTIRRLVDDVPGNGIGYGLLRYLTEEHGDALAALPQSEIGIDYLGWFERPAPGGPLGAPSRAPARLVSPTAPPRYLLDVVVAGVEDRLVIDLTHATDVCSTRDAVRLLDEVVHHLNRLADPHPSATPGRPPLVGVEDGTLP